jgi:hypothetical protein
MAADNGPPPTYDDKVDDDTLALMYDEVSGLQGFLQEWRKDVDSKTVAVFTVGSVLLTAIPAAGGVGGPWWKWLLWGVAAGLWIIGGYFLYSAFTPRAFKVGPDASKLIQPDWTGRKPGEYRFYRVQDIGELWTDNWETINRKADDLRTAMVFIGAESIALLVALLVQRS